MRAASRSVLTFLLLVSLPASGQVLDPALFGDGHLPVYRTEDTDRRFLKTGVARALESPPREPACQRIVATLLVAYADALPYLHRRDQNFYVDPALLQTLQRTASSPDFPAEAYLAAMIRRTFLAKKVPAAWIKMGEAMERTLQVPIATGRMRPFAGGLEPIDSFLFNVPALLDRYAREVKLATSVAVGSADDRFRDEYMDRDVTWGGLVLRDIAEEAPPPPPKRKKGRHHPEDDAPPANGERHTWAVVGYPLGKPPPVVPGIPSTAQVPQLQIRARLRDDQPLDLDKLSRGERVAIKGHLWDIGPNMAWVEIRDAYVFPDPDWSTWPGIASPQDVRDCPIAVNDLSPNGFRPHPAAGQADPFLHVHE